VQVKEKKREKTVGEARYGCRVLGGCAFGREKGEKGGGEISILHSILQGGREVGSLYHFRTEEVQIQKTVSRRKRSGGR